MVVGARAVLYAVSGVASRQPACSGETLASRFPVGGSAAHGEVAGGSLAAAGWLVRCDAVRSAAVLCVVARVHAWHSQWGVGEGARKRASLVVLQHAQTTMA